jgi:hypothetical protein
LLAVGDTTFLKPNVQKLNIFSQKDHCSLLKDVMSHG